MKKQDRSWLAFVVAVVGLLVSLGVWLHLLGQERSLLKEATNAAVSGTRQVVVNGLNSRVLAIRRLAQRMARGILGNESDWRMEALNLVGDTPGLEALIWFRGDGGKPFIFASSPEVERAVDNPVFLAWAREAARSGEDSAPVLSRPFRTRQSVQAFSAVTPVVSGSGDVGYVAAVFEYPTFFESLFSTFSPDFQISILVDDDRVYTRYGEAVDDDYTRAGLVKTQSGMWQISVTPTGDFIWSQRSLFPHIILLCGVLVSVLLALTVHYGQVSRTRANEAHHLLDVLRRESTERRRAEDALRTVVEGTAGKTGERLMEALVETLARALDVKYCMVTEIAERDHARLKTLAFWEGDRLGQRIEYEINCTPCADVLRGEERFVGSELAKLYPEDVLAVKMGIESYFGVPLIADKGECLGLLAVMDTRPMESSPIAHYLLGLFASRAASELVAMHARREVEASEEIYRKAIENASGVPYMHRFGTNTYDFVGKGVEKVLGIPASGLTMDFLTRNVKEVVVRARGVTLAPKAYGEAFRRGDFPTFLIDFRIETPIGERWIHDSAVLVRDANSGEIIGDLGVMQDITDRKRAEDALRAQAAEIALWQQRYEAAIEATGQVLYDWDIENNRVAWAGCVEEMLGFPKSSTEIEFTALADLVHHEDRPLFDVEMGKAISEKRGFRLEFRLRQPSGSFISVEQRGLPFGNGQGMPVRIVGLITDLSARKAAEEERLAVEQKIQHTQKLESLGVLAGGIAHDFNNLLVAILGNASLALMDLRPESPVRPVIEQIERAAQRAAELAGQMLAYSGKGRFVVQRLDLNALVEEMTHLLSVMISKKIVMKFNLADNLPPVEGDVTQIRQVIMNLVTNAADAIGERSGVVTISTGAMYADQGYFEGIYLREDLPAGNYVYVEISDTGCGMDRDTMKRIFDPFFTTKSTGRGLGLAALLGITRGHRGGVKVYSEAGRGTTFKVLFPQSEATADLPSGEVEVRHSSGEIRKLSGAILVVDDEPTVRTVAQSILERFGFEVLTAENGRQGVKVFEENADRILLVLMDMTMPQLDGAEAYREMRRVREDVCVILSSGYNEQEAVNRFAGKGLAGFIQKPYRPQDLMAKIREVLDTRFEANG